MNQTQLPPSFYQQDAIELAPKLLGKVLQFEEVAIRILETEAYMPIDSACHAHRGKTKRNAPMFEEGGILYVYLCYGIHQMLNVVSGKKGEAQAVLIRAGEVLSGTEVVCTRRKNLDLIGPGKLTQALAINNFHSGEPLYRQVHIWDAPLAAYTCHPRVGIDYALPKDRDALWRFVTPSVHVPKKPLVRKIKL